MQDKKETLGVGFIGCGGHCCGSNIPCADKNPNLELVAFCDLREEQLKMLEEQYTSKFTTTDMEKIFADPDVDLVVCATKPDFRLPVMEMALKYKKPLFVEKPLAYTREDIFKAVDLMRSSGVPLIVGFNRPYSPMMQAVRPIFRKHRKGNTTIVYRIVGESDIWPPEHYHNVIVRKESTVCHETTHIFDLLNWLTGDLPSRIQMVGGGHMDNVITLDYPGDTTAVIIAGDNGSVGYPKERLEIDTSCGTIIGEFFVELNAVGVGNDSGTQYFKSEFKGKPLLGIEQLKQALFKWRSNLTEEKRKVGHFFGQTPTIDKGHYGQLEYFRQQIISGSPIETDVVAGAIATLIAWEATESWKHGTPLKLDFSELLNPK